MNADPCETCLEHVDAYVEGTLDPTARSAVELHLATCAACRQIADDAAFLRPLVAALPRSEEPGMDGWPALLEALQAQKAPRVAASALPDRRWRPTRTWRWLAAAVALVAIGSGLGWALHDRTRTSPALATIDIDRFEAQIHAASAELVLAVDARKSELDPETVETIERNLAIIDAAIAETRAALERSPDDRRAADALVAVHQQKIRLLRHVLWAPGHDG